MPVPAPNLYPQFNIVRLSHVALNVTDLAASRAFYADTLGLQVTHEGPSTITLRGMEERGHHSIVLYETAPASAEVLGFKLYDESDLQKAARWFTALGLPVSWVDRPWQGKTLLTHDRQGIPLEFYARMDKLPPIHQKYKLYHGAKPLRIDHFNCFSTDVEASVSFYNAIGFRITEYAEDSGNGRMWAAWMHRKGNVSDIAFTNGRGPRLHHTAFRVSSPLDIIGLLDLMSTTGYLSNIEWGPGRHGISNGLFLYVRDPDGHRIKLCCSHYQTVGPDHEPIKWDLKDPQRQTLWGAPAPRPWLEEGSDFAGVATKEPFLMARPTAAS